MASQPLRIRDVYAEDIEELSRIDKACFPAEIAFTKGEIAFFLYHPESIAWIAEWSGRILGFLIAKLEGRSRARVITLDVVPGFRQRKIGTRLMDRLHAELKARGVEKSVLEVAVKNTPAQRLYEKQGYRYERTLAGYYGGREDAHRMVRKEG